jgi:acyl-lipid omega-6 desaturase (Delta-12 desaturase)
VDREAERRAGAELVRATKPFSEEDPVQSWLLLGISLAVFGLLDAGALFGPWYLAFPAAIAAGFAWVRIFIFFHDYLHGAIFRNSIPGELVMKVVGVLTLSPAPVWAQTHDYHHHNNAKMLGAAIGSYPTVSIGIWSSLTPSQRFWYKFARNPLTMLFGYVPVFMGGMCMAAFFRDPKVHWQGPLAVVVHFGLVGLVGWTLGPLAAFTGVMLPLAVSCALGSYLFYAQHNFPACELRDRSTWTYHHAALRASSMFDMNPLLHWLTGNIGYHHVHHLNHKIPFYRLPEAMAAIPELQNPGRTSWSWSDMKACLQLKLWDPERNRLVSWEEANVPH